MRILQLANCADNLNSWKTVSIRKEADFSAQVLVSSALMNKMLLSELSAHGSGYVQCKQCLSNMLLIFPLCNAPCNCNSNCPFLARTTLDYHKQQFFSEHYDKNLCSSSFIGNEKCSVKYKCPMLVCEWVYLLAQFTPWICKGSVWLWFVISAFL